MAPDTAHAPPALQDAFRFLLQSGGFFPHLTFREIAAVRMVSRDCESWGAYGQPLALQALKTHSDQAARLQLLHDALSSGPTRFAHELLLEHAPQLVADDIECLSARKHTFLHVAAGTGSTPKMRLLLQHGWAPLILQPTLNQRKASCLHIAAFAGNTPMVTALIEAAGHSVVELLLGVDFKQCTGLHAAALAGHAETMRVILSAAARVGVQGHMLLHTDYKLRTTLYKAVKSGSIEAVEALLDTPGIGAVLAHEDFRAQNCLYGAARGQSVEVMKALLRAAEKEDILAQMLLSRDIMRCSCLHEAAFLGDAPLVRTLLEAAERMRVRMEFVLMKNDHGLTCLDLAISMYKAQNVEALLSGIGALEMSALMISQRDNGDNCFLAAVRTMGPRTLFELISAAGRVHGLLERLLATEDSDGQGLLHVVVTHMRFEHPEESMMVRLLLCDTPRESARALVLKQTKEGLSSLYCAIARAKTRAAKQIFLFACRLDVVDETLQITDDKMAENNQGLTLTWLRNKLWENEGEVLGGDNRNVYSKVLGRVLP